MIEGRIGESSWRVMDRVLAEHARRMDAQQEQLRAHAEMHEILNRRIDTLQEYRQAQAREDATRDKRIGKLVERLDRAYTKIHALERKMRGNDVAQ
jgi:predicted RNase H-like nuclease (RuvC/YqgF family)